VELGDAVELALDPADRLVPIKRKGLGIVVKGDPQRGGLRHHCETADVGGKGIHPISHGKKLGLVQVEALIGGLPKHLHDLAESLDIRRVKRAQDDMAVICIKVPSDNRGATHLGPHCRAGAEEAVKSPRDVEVFTTGLSRPMKDARKRDPRLSKGSHSRRLPFWSL
jgi:hypothetical protein